ncbi:Uncharacterised protein [Klebsiella michiganensis]|nr:Uncharacterised protein [Klebsiella michiganensis]
MPERRLSRRGKQPASGPFPRGGALRLARATGSPPSAGLVARTDAQHRLREIRPLCTVLPRAARCACPGYGFTAVCGSGSPDRCAASPPGNSATLHSAPGGGAMRLARATGSCDLGGCSPDKALAAIRETSSTTPFLRAFCINHPVQPRHHDRHDHRYAQGHQANFAEDIGINRQRL